MDNLTREQYRDLAALVAMGVFLSKLPIPGVPKGQWGQAGPEFIRAVVQDSFDMAQAMAEARRARNEADGAAVTVEVRPP